MAEATLSSKNQLVIPREAREALQLKPGDKLLVTAHNNRMLVIERPKSYRLALKGIAKGMYPKDYLKKERADW